MSQIYGRGTISGMAGIGDFLTDNAVVVLPDAGGTVTLTGGTTGLVLNGSANTVTLAGTLVVANGGTGATSLTDGGILLGSGTGAVTVTAQPTNGQLLIGSTGVDPVLATLASADSSVTITNGAGTINLAANAAASGAVISLTTDDLNVVVPTGAGNINLVGAHGLNTSGAVANTASVQINNAITLGDLSNIAADTDALTISTGDITFSATNNVGNIHLPRTHSSGNAGIITFGTASQMRLHTFGDYTSGTSCVWLGNDAGNFTNTGNRNIGIGTQAGNSLTSGLQNTAIGDHAFFGATSGGQNVAIGTDALDATLTGNGNTAVGMQALTAATSAEWNVGVGRSALVDLQSGSYNVGIGGGQDGTSGVLMDLVSGSFNVAIGGATGAATGGAGRSYTGSESSNICIGNATVGTTGESNVMRLGTTGSGSGQVNKCYLAGVDGVNVGSVAKVLTMASDQVGTATITAGANITVTPGANTITIAATAVAFTWAVTTIDASIVVNNGYIANKAGLLTMTLPASGAIGDIIEITGINTAVGWRIAQNANQQIFFGTSSTTVGITGYIEATNIRDSARLVCVVSGASTVWNVISSVGNITIA